MTKKILITILAIGMSLHVTGCSSSGTQEEGDAAVANDEAFAEEGEGDFAEEPIDDGSGAVASEDGAPADDGGGDELSVDDGQGVADNGEAAPADDGGGDELSLDEGGGDDLALEGDNGSQEQTLEGGDELALDDGSAGGDELSLDGDNSGDQGLPDDIASSDQPPAEQPPIAAEPPPTDEPIFGGDEGSTDMAATDSGALPEETPATTESAPSDVAASGMTDTAPAVADVAPPAPVSFIPVVKIKDAAFTKSGTLLNRVYLARPGDNMKQVSNKIYGTADRAPDLLTWNPHLKRGVKTGDKVYYSSPRDPNDTRMLTFYEDMGAQPSVYVSKEGDNIRRVSKELLGSKDSWKEVWATNMNVESKGDIPQGIELRYWPDGAESNAAPVMASNSAPQAPDMPPPDMAQAAPPAPPMDAQDPLAAPPPPPDMAMNDPMAAPPSGPGPASTPDSAAMGSMEPPPPPADSMAPPPPPPPEPPAPPKPKKAPPVDVASGSDPDTVMAIGFGGILLIAAAVLFVVIRKNRAKRMDLGQTQV